MSLTTHGCPKDLQRDVHAALRRVTGHGTTARAARHALGSFVVAGLMILAVHQPVIWLLHRTELVPWHAFEVTPTGPLGVPVVVNAVFWGAMWGPVINALRGMHARAPTRHLLAGVGVGILTTIVGGILLRYGHGVAIPSEKRVAAACASVLINATWAGVTSLLIERWITPDSAHSSVPDS